MKIKRALISVYKKDGIVELAKFLAEKGVEIIASGGTQKTLVQAGIQTVAVEDITNFPEMLNGRVKTLHPAIFGGILAKKNDDHLQQIKDNHIKPIELVIVNLYPFEETIAQDGCTFDKAIEQIDIGGPSLIRAAAKNHEYVTVITSPAQYADLIEQLQKLGGETSIKFRKECAIKAFELTTAYDRNISKYLSEQFSGSRESENQFILEGEKIQSLRYGENPHQQAAFYKRRKALPLGNFKQLHGKELSYNNILDLDSAIQLVCEFEIPAAVIIKHNNPCGAGTGINLAEAYKKALATDSLSAFGGIVGVNREVDGQLANIMSEMFFECVMAPEFSSAAIAQLSQKKNLRLITFEPDKINKDEWQIRTVAGGFLVQAKDSLSPDIRSGKVVTKRIPTESEWQALAFAWKLAKHVRSNAIVFSTSDQAIGIGAGQMSRVNSSEIAVMKAKKSGLDTRGCAVASDAFFPFKDGVEALAAAGATAVIQPGGSVRDAEVIEAADENNMTMVFTGNRHFKH